MSSVSISAYNSDKTQLQDSITKVYQTIEHRPGQPSPYEGIHEETSRLSYRQEVIYNMVSTIAVVAVFMTLRRMT